MTLQDFVSKYEGKGIDFDKSYGFQCQDLYRQYVKEVLGFPQIPAVAGAKDNWDKYLPEYYQRIANTPEGVPMPGDIILWGSSYGPYGHVAICIKATSSTLTCFSQNDPTGSLCITKLYRSYKGVIGWLHPLVQSTQEFMQIEKKVFESLVTKSTAYDKFVEAGYLDAQSVTLSMETYTDRISTLKNGFDDFLREMVTILDPNTVIEIADQDLVKNLAKKVVSDFSSVQSELLKKEKQWQQQEKSLEDENLELEKQVGSLRQEVERLLKRIDRVETDLQTYKDKKAENDKFYGFIETIKRLFERTK